MSQNRIFTYGILFVTLWLTACRGEVPVLPPESDKCGEPIISSVRGFYQLNEGNMGTNKATLDYYDFTTATYTRDIFSWSNPSVTQGLGDVGNDIRIYGSKLYAVINCSNLVEVMDARTAKHIGTISIPNCRYIVFDGAFGYITSYAGPVVIDSTKAQIGYVAKIDTATLAILDTCHVGFQPDEMAIVGKTLYVANSGGYMVPNYENTLSMVDMESFHETGRIEVARNLQCVRRDNHNQLWVTSRGDYYNQLSRLYCVDPVSNTLVDSVLVTASGLWIDGDSLYVYGSDFNYVTMKSASSYNIVNTVTHEIVSTKLFGDSVNIRSPYGIMVHPVTKDVYIADAKNNVNPGTLWSIAPDGHPLWSVRTGDIPGHFALLYK